MDDRRTVEGHNEASKRWMADQGEQDDEEFGAWPLTAIAEKETLEKVDPQARRDSLLPGMFPASPQMVARGDLMMTPGNRRKRDRDGTLSTPPRTTANGNDIPITPISTRRMDVMADARGLTTLLSPSLTPTPSRFRDTSQRTDALDLKDYTITEEVMNVLQDQNLEHDTISRVRHLLNKHALKTQGIVRGRDIVRLALKSKDAKIAELQQRITTLEAERETGRLVIKHFKSDMASSVQAQGRAHRGGGGRGRGS